MLKMLVEGHGVKLKVVLTGGPCGGKTTAMSRLSGIKSASVITQ